MFGQETEKKKKTAAEIAKEGAGRLGRFGETTKKGGDTVKNIQEYAKREAERKRKEDEEKKKKKTEVNTAPEEGFLTRMYRKYISGGKKEK